MRKLRYTLTPGHVWVRSIFVKDRITHRPRALKSVAANMKLQGSNVVLPIGAEVNREGGVTLTIEHDDSLTLTAGVWDFDVVGDFRGSAEKVAEGTISVEGVSNITPLSGSADMHIYYLQYTDYRKVFTWLDADGSTVLDVSDARMQARDADDAVILDIGFFSDVPDEVAISALPDNQRGYLSPIDGASVELHISNQVVVAPGEYEYDILGQRSDTGDWGKLESGSITVIDAVTDPSS